MTSSDALARVEAKFPFKGYINPIRGYLNVAETALRHLPPGSTVLDFGAGPGDKTAVLQLLGYQCSVVDDLSDNWHKKGNNRELILTFLREMGINYADSLDSLRRTHDKGFDMVMMHDVLEHMHLSPRNLLNDIIELTKSGGLIFLTVPNAVNLRKRIDVLFGETNLPNFDIYYWYPDPWRGHVREYTKSDLTKLASHLDLEILELRSCHHMLEVLPGWARPVFTLVTRLFPGWRDTWLMVARKKKGWTARRTLSEQEMEKVIGPL